MVMVRRPKECGGGGGGGVTVDSFLLGKSIGQHDQHELGYLGDSNAIHDGEDDIVFFWEENNYCI